MRSHQDQLYPAHSLCLLPFHEEPPGSALPGAFSLSLTFSWGATRISSTRRILSVPYLFMRSHQDQLYPAHSLCLLPFHEEPLGSALPGAFSLSLTFSWGATRISSTRRILSVSYLFMRSHQDQLYTAHSLCLFHHLQAQQVLKVCQST